MKQVRDLRGTNGRVRGEACKSVVIPRRYNGDFSANETAWFAFLSSMSMRHGLLCFGVSPCSCSQGCEVFRERPKYRGGDDPQNNCSSAGHGIGMKEGLSCLPRSAINVQRDFPSTEQKGGTDKQEDRDNERGVEGRKGQSSGLWDMGCVCMLVE